MHIEPLVTIVCLTYNEEDFVRDALNSFLSQKTEFSYEVLVYDDASEDHTPEILQEYAEKFPNVFHLTLYKENNFKKGLGFWGLREGFREARGKYIAYCEGDDYWCDDHKLEKQVKFLEANPEYAVCAHETLIRNDYYKANDGVLFSTTDVNIFLDRAKKRCYTFQDALTGNIFHISSIMFRNNAPIIWPIWISKVAALDMILFMLLAERGPIYVMADVMSVYRYRKNSITSTPVGDFRNAISFIEASVQILIGMDKYWQYKYHFLITPIISRYYMRAAFVCLSKSGRNMRGAFLYLKRAYLYNNHIFWKYLYIESKNKLHKHIDRLLSM